VESVREAERRIAELTAVNTQLMAQGEELRKNNTQLSADVDSCEKGLAVAVVLLILMALALILVISSKRRPRWADY
jgi:hypothetical protein